MEEKTFPLNKGQIIIIFNRSEQNRLRVDWTNGGYHRVLAKDVS